MFHPCGTVRYSQSTVNCIKGTSNIAMEYCSNKLFPSQVEPVPNCHHAANPPFLWTIQAVPDSSGSESPVPVRERTAGTRRQRGQVGMARRDPDQLVRWPSRPLIRQSARPSEGGREGTPFTETRSGARPDPPWSQACFVAVPHCQVSCGTGKDTTVAVEDRTARKGIEPAGKCAAKAIHHAARSTRARRWGRERKFNQ